MQVLQYDKFVNLNFCHVLSPVYFTLVWRKYFFFCHTEVVLNFPLKWLIYYRKKKSEKIRIRIIFHVDWNIMLKLTQWQGFYYHLWNCQRCVIAQFRHQTFHEPNLIRIKADPNYLDRRLNSVIQTQLLIPAELNSKGEKCSFWSNCLQNTSL